MLSSLDICISTGSGVGWMPQLRSSVGNRMSATRASAALVFCRVMPM